MPRPPTVLIPTVLACLAFAPSAPAQEPTPPNTSPTPVTHVKDDPYTSPRTQWYRDAKYGLFIHWGLYAVPAGEWKGQRDRRIGEWIMHNRKIPIYDYEALARQFNPAKFDAKEWARVAKAAGMKYVVITSKHHDGFCLWDTALTGYDVVDATPFKRDVIRELADACRDEGLKFAFYHSIMDWHRPELAGYWNAGKDAATDPGDPRVTRYVEGQLKPQLRELITKYDPAILWFDGEWVPWWTEEKGRDLEAFCRGLKGDVIVNNRIGKRKMTDGDYETPEQEIPVAALGKRLWETCMTLNDTWGYKHFDHNWKKPQDVVRKLCDIAGKGGNFLLNVGPKADGTIPEESVRILEEAGRWVHAHGDAIYGTTFALAAPPKWGTITRKGNTWYAIVFDWPADGKLLVPAATPVSAARLLHGEGVVQVVPRGDKGVELTLPATKPAEPAAVVVLDFANEPKPTKGSGAGETIEPGIDRSFTLPAGAAVARGKTIRVEPGSIGYWSDPKDYVEWVLEAKEAGRYEVSLTYAVGPGAGGKFTVAVGADSFDAKAEPTGGWDQYQTVKVGQITVPQGRSGLTVKPKGKPSGALMNLQSVKLDPK